MSKMFNIIVAHDENNGIGKDQGIPWTNIEDMKRFKSLTIGSTVIMGKNTFLSMGKPLQNRQNIVISNTLEPGATFDVACSLDDSLRKATRRNIFVIGGERLYREALRHPKLHRAYITKIEGNFECDTFFPELTDGLHEIDRIDLNDNSHMQIYERNVEEHQYLDLVRSILTHGSIRDDRTGTGTHSIFGTQMRFDLSDRFPLLTSKRVFWRGLAEELFWFISGDTNAKSLQDKNVHIWDGNSTRQFLDGRNLDYEEGELGPVYGYQWRCFGGNYPDRDNGCDQLQDVINLIQTNPDSRRILLSAWNPKQMDQMALPPCHVLYQFYVDQGTLSCSMYQRSGDIGLGIPFNIASASLLTCILAKHCDLMPGHLILSIGDAHVYNTHVEAMREQIEREPRLFPRLTVQNNYERIEDYSLDDLLLENYQPMKSIRMEMAV